MSDTENTFDGAKKMTKTNETVYCTINWSENGHVNALAGQKFDSVEKFSQVLWGLSYSIDREQLGYDKTQVTLTTDSGDEYTARLDLQHPDADHPDFDVKSHVLDHCLFLIRNPERCYAKDEAERIETLTTCVRWAELMLDAK